MRPTPGNMMAAVLTVLFLGVGQRQVWAQSPTDPFGQPETSRPRKAPVSTESVSSDKPLLEPMDGINSGVPKSAGPGTPEKFEPYRPTPYTAGPAGDQAYADDPGVQQAPQNRGLDRPNQSIEPGKEGVQRTDLTPVTAGGGAELPYELWRGLSETEIETLLAGLEIPPRSVAMHGLWRRLITSEVATPSGGGSSDRFAALRIEALDRSGLLTLARSETDKIWARGAVSDPLLRLVSARVDISTGNSERGCATAKSVAGAKEDLPSLLKAEAIVMTGYCVAASGNRDGAGIAVGLAREHSHPGSVGLDALDAIAAGTKPELAEGTVISLLDFRILELAGVPIDARLAARASPGLAAFLAVDRSRDAAIRLTAGEVAARLNSITPDELAEIYRSQPRNAAPETLVSDALVGMIDPGLRRAGLLEAATSERTPQKKTRYIRAFLDDARRAGLYWPALVMVAKDVAEIQPIPEIGWFAETAIETQVAAGNFEQARAWAEFASTLDSPAGDMRHWIALVDIADSKVTAREGADSAAIERLAGDGRFNPTLLHRLVTSLEALGTQVPISLWEAASRTAQPNEGYLPSAGVLSALLESSKKQEFGHTILLVMKALGPTGTEGAHLIAVGDAIRALKRAGLDEDARRLAVEALFTAWPRALSN